MIEELSELNIYHEEHFDTLVDLVHLKSMNEKGYCDMYANLCYEISNQMSADKKIIFLTYLFKLHKNVKESMTVTLPLVAEGKSGGKKKYNKSKTKKQSKKRKIRKTLQKKKK